MSRETLYILQLLGVVGAGGFIGEFYRSVTAQVNLKMFIANFLASAFLSFFISYMTYTTFHNKNAALVTGALLSYQDEKFIGRFVKNALNNILKGGK